MIIKTADKYIMVQFLKPLIIVFLTFVGLFIFIDTAEKIRPIMNFVNSGRGSWSEVASFVFGNLFCYFMDMMPLVLSLAIAACFVALNKTGQMRAFASFSLTYKRLFAGPLLFSFALGVVYLGLSFSLLPLAKKTTETAFKKIKNMQDLFKDIIVKDQLSIDNLGKEFQKNNSSISESSFNLKPAVLQIIEVRNLSGETGSANEMIILRFDENNRVVSRVQLLETKFVDGFISGEKGELDIYRDDTLIKSFTFGPERLFVTNFNKNSILSEYFISEDASQVSISTLFKKRSLNQAKEEMVSRMMYPFMILMFGLLSVAICTIFNFTQVYLCFALVLGLLMFYVILSIGSAIILPVELKWMSGLLTVVMGYLITMKLYQLVR